jgi:hypothetical protein
MLNAGANGAQVYDSVMANARSKIVFSLDGEENLKPLAQSLFMGVMNPDEIKLKLFSRKIMDYSEETRTVRSESKNWSEGIGAFTGVTGTEGEGGAVSDGAAQESRIWNTTSASSDGTSRTSMEGGSSSESEVPFLRPIMGMELSSVQYRSIEEQLFKAMVTLYDQDQRHGVAKLVGMRAPVNIVTPIIEKEATTKNMAATFLTRKYEKLPFALKSTEARKQIEERDRKFVANAGRQVPDEEIAPKRKVP